MKSVVQIENSPLVALVSKPTLRCHPERYSVKDMASKHEARSFASTLRMTVRCGGAAQLMLALLLFLVTGCSSAPPSNLPTTRVMLGSKTFTLEIANTDPTRETGLMKRDSMPDDHGMIFVFSDEKRRDFWMKNTRFDLDIAFINGQGQVVSIKQMKAYDLNTTSSDAPAKYAIELNSGAAANAGLIVGNSVNIPPEARNSKD